MEDLLNYKVKVRKALTFGIKEGGLLWHLPPAPGGGPLVAGAVKILDKLNLSSADFSSMTGTVETYRRLLEALRFSSARRGEFGDPDFVDVKNVATFDIFGYQILFILLFMPSKLKYLKGYRRAAIRRLC